MTAITGVSDRTFGLFLNMGANLAPTTAGVFDLMTLREADAANNSVTTIVGHRTPFHPIRHQPRRAHHRRFLLGRTERIRVGTAVTLSPLLHPVEMAERSALLDQLSGGRFSLGLGRGGYRKDYDVLGVDFARWDDEPASSARQILTHWAPESDLQPRRSRSRIRNCYSAPPVRPAWSWPLAMVLRCNTISRCPLSRGYRSNRPTGHSIRWVIPGTCTLTVIVVDDDPDIRHRLERLRCNRSRTATIRTSRRPRFTSVPTESRSPPKIGEDGRARHDRRLGQQVVDGLGRFIKTTGARRLAFYAEAIADADITMRTITDLSRKVIPSSDTAATSARAPFLCSWLVYTDCVRPSRRRNASKPCPPPRRSS